MVSQTDSPTLEALRNWHPRMIANGVDYNDAEETLKRVESWEDWCREWCDTAAVHESLEEDGAVWRTAIAAAVTEDGRRETRLERLERE